MIQIPSKECPMCKQVFFKKPSHSMRSWDMTVKYCSMACYAKSLAGKDLLRGNRFSGKPWNMGMKMGKSPRNTRVAVECLVCGASVEVPQARKDKAHYCSHDCAHKHRDHGKTPEAVRIRKCAAYSAWRKAVFERDDYTCQHCGVRGGQLNADHIKPFALYPDLRLNVDNGQTLCVPCHLRTPTYGNRKLAVAQET